MLSAFQAQAVHELKPRDKSKIESLLAYGDRLLVGLNNGALRVYRFNEVQPNGEASERVYDAQGPPAKPKAVELLREEEKFSKRPVQQIAIIKEANLLVSLSDGYVSLHDLQTYQLVDKIEQTRGAACFTTRSNVDKDAETGVPSLISRLAVGVKRKVLCWTWQDMEQLPDAVEIGLEASVKSLTWATGTRLVVGMDPGFSLVDIESEEITPVSKPASRAADGSGELAGVRFGAVSSSGMGYMGMGSWMPRPMATGLSDNHMLLAKDVNTLFTDIDGKALEKRQVPWSFAPESIGYSYPYLLALQTPDKGSLQIRSPDTLSLLQTISVPSATVLHVPQPNISLAHAGKGFLVASERVIWRMNALPYDAQLQDLVDGQRFDEAISLLSLLEDTLIDGKEGRIREVKIKKAIVLFQQQKYRPALDLLTDAEAPPERVIALYPKSIAGELSSIPDSPETSEVEQTGDEGDGKPDEAIKESASTPSKTFLGRVKGGHSKKDSDAGSIKSGVGKGDSTDVLGPRKRATDKPLHGEDLKMAVRCLCSFLAQARVQVQKHLSTDGTLKENPPALDSETRKPAFANILPQAVFEASEYNKIDWQTELLQTAKLVDTTLFRAYTLALPSLAGPLFRLDNFCDPEVVQSSLYQSSRYNDLIDFLHGKKLHRQALELLSKFGKGETDGDVPGSMHGPERTVGYLKLLPTELVDLILEFVHWPLQEKPEVGMDVFLADTENAEHLPRDQVLQFLASIDPRLETQYLEHIINELGDQTHTLHQHLIELYLAPLKQPDTPQPTKDVLKPELEEFLRTSKSYNTGKTFRLLPSSDPTFYESRALVLSAMGNHKQALSIYVFQLDDHTKAEDYCTRIYLSQQHQQTTPGAPAADSSTNNIFSTLLGLYLNPPADPSTDTKPSYLPQALDLLSTHGPRLPPHATLASLPDTLLLSQLSSYFTGRIRASTTEARQKRILAALTGVQRQSAEGKLLLGKPDVAASEPGVGEKAGLVARQGRSAWVRIGEGDHCGVCGRRFGGSAVKFLPEGKGGGGEVVHYGCAGKRDGVGLAVGGGSGSGSGRRGWG